MIGAFGFAGDAAKFEWQRTRVEPPTVVPPPWHPVRVQGDSVEVWGRRYELAASALPRQAHSAGDDLLAGPAYWIVNGRTFADSEWKLQWSKPRDTAVAADATTAIGSLRLRLTTTIAYDGLADCALTITSNERDPLRSLTLVLPVRSEVAKYLNYSSVTSESGSKPWSPGSLDRIRVNGTWRSAFLPVVWLGDERRGVAWCADSTQGWRTRGDGSEIEISDDGKSVLLMIHFIQEGAVGDVPGASAQLRFAWLATPSKPLPADWRNRRFINETNEQRRQKRGNVSILWHNLWSEALGSPRPRDPAILRKLVEDAHRDGYKAIPYLALTDTLATIASEGGSANADVPDVPIPEISALGDAWNHGPCSRGWSRGQSAAHWGVRACPRSGWSEFLLHYIDRLIREDDIDGLYLDNAFLLYCDKAEHGCGYVGPDGQRHVTNTLFAQRDLLERVYMLFIAAGKQPIIMMHSSTDILLPSYSFVHATLDGEQFNRHWRPPANFEHLVPLDLFRAHYHGGQFGVASVFLPSPEFRTETEMRQHLAYTLIHDTQLMKGWMDSRVLENVWDITSAFAPDDSDRQIFTGYWENLHITASDASVKISYWERADRVLMAASNLSRSDQTVTVSIDEQELGSAVEPCDPLDGSEIQLRESRFDLSIPARDFRLVQWRRTARGLESRESVSPPLPLDASARVDLPGAAGKDSSANGNDIEAASYCELADGKSGNAVRLLAGNGGYLRVPHDDSLSATNALTLELWIKSEPNGVSIDDFQDLISRDPITDPLRNSEGLRSYRLAIGPERYIRFELALGGKQVVLDTAANAMPVNEWVHLAGVYDGRTMSIWINGALTATQDANGEIAALAGPLHLGNSSFAAGYRAQFDGLMDEIRIWNRALRSAELRNHTLRTTQGLRGYWRFEPN